LSHFTAVSGSNVALFLGILFVASGPLSLGPKRRAVVGLVGIPIYAAATRFEPSVMRASVMAGLVLAGRLFDLTLEAWQLLAAAVIVLLTLDPGLATHLGFQLSVAATAGVLVGARWPVAPGRARRALAVSLGAQAAVAPLLIGSFGGIPLLSPAVNLVAAPLVAAATVLGVVGVLGIDPLLDLAVWIAGLVLGLARAASRWPQIGWPGTALIVALTLGFTLLRRVRGPIAIGAAVAVVTLLLGGGSGTPGSGVVAFDIGQGDALLLSGGDGRFALVDGGPDPVLLLENLVDYRVRRLELVVLTHTHADHAAGLAGLVGRIPIGRFWAVTKHQETDASRDLLGRLSSLGVAIAAPEPGDRYDLGSLDLTVLGPLRRYSSPNDESIVMLVEGPARTMLLTGDVEAIAQSDLGTLRSDVLKVPHHGAATSNLGWLTGVGAELAVISVGDNDFGHPAPNVMAALESSGADVVRTDLEGDVIVDLG
jgi:competence protein ComEC